MRDLVARYRKNRIKFKFLDWDTQFFKINSFLLDTTQANVEKNEKEFTQKVTDSLGKSFAVAKIPISLDPNLVAFLRQLDFRYICTEFTLLFNNKSLCGHDLFKDVTIEKAKHLPPDAYLLGKEFSLTRFHLDRNISAEKADLLWINYIKNFRLDPKHHLFVAKVKDRTIGGIFVKQYKEKGKTISNFFCVSLRKKYRNRNIGSMLLKYASDWCSEQSDMIIVGTQAHNTKAVNFYAKNGFSKIMEAKLILHRWML